MPKDQKKGKKSSAKAGNRNKRKPISEAEYQRIRREARHRRRVKSTILCWILLIIILIAGVIGVMFAGHKVSDFVNERKEAKLEQQRKEEAKKEAERQAAEDAEAAEDEEPEAEPEEYTDEDLLNDMIEACIDEMSEEDKIAGLFFTTPEVLTGVGQVVQAGDSTEEALKILPVGGLVYHNSNVKNENQFAAMLTDTIDRSKYPLFLVMNETSDELNNDAITEYGINLDFDGAAEDSGTIIEATPLPSGSSSETISVAVLDGAGDNVAEEMISAMGSGATMFYITNDIDNAFKSFVSELESNDDMKQVAADNLEKIYRIKYSSRVE